MHKDIQSNANQILLLAKQAEKEPSKAKRRILLTQMQEAGEAIENLCTDTSYEKEHPTWREKTSLLKALNIEEEALKGSIKKEKKHSAKNTYANIANIFFESCSEYIMKSAPSATKKLQKQITEAGYNSLSRSYLSTMFFTTFFLFFLGSACGVILFYTFSLWYGLSLGFFLGLISLLTFLFYPSFARRRREKELEEELPFIIQHCTALAQAKLKARTIFLILLQSPYYDSFKKDCQRIINYTTYLNKTLPEALQTTAENNPSEKTKDFLRNLAKLLDEKKDLHSYLEQEAKESLQDYKRKKNFIQRYKNAKREIKGVIKMLDFKLSYLYSALSIILGLFLLTQYYGTEREGFFPLITLLILLSWSPILYDIIRTMKKTKAQETEFFHFIKELKETKNPQKLNNNYKELRPNIEKLKNQQKLGLPEERIFLTFARETKNPIITATTTMALEAKTHGAEFYTVLYELGRAKILRRIWKS